MTDDGGASAGKSADQSDAADARSGRLIEYSVPVSEDADYIPALRALFDQHGGGSAVETRYRGPEDGAAFKRPETWVRTWIPEGDATARALVEEGLWRLTREHSLPAAAVTPLAKANWAEAWKEHYAPLTIGPFWVTPAWHDVADAPDGAHVIRLDPGMAFGTGQHPTTRLCLCALADVLADEVADEVADKIDARAAEDPRRPVSEIRVLDVGTGSGVLAIAAARLGAKLVVGIDIDPAAVAATEENAELNGVHVRAVAGSLDVLAALDDMATLDDLPYDLVLANLLAHTLRDLADGLRACTADGGTLIGSGILVEQVADVTKSLERAGFRPERVAIDGDWAAIIMRAG